MKTSKLNNWLLPGINGILAIIFGIIAIVFPSITLIVLAVYFAISIMIGGILLILGAIRTMTLKTGRSLQLFEGVVGLLLGIAILSNPKLSVAVFVAIFGIWAMLLGLFFIYIYFNISF